MPSWGGDLPIAVHDAKHLNVVAQDWLRQISSRCDGEFWVDFGQSRQAPNDPK